MAIMKKKLKFERSSYEILQILSASLFDKMPMVTLISDAVLQEPNNPNETQAKLLDY